MMHVLAAGRRGRCRSFNLLLTWQTRQQARALVIVIDRPALAIQGLQALTLDRSPDLLAAMYGAGGVLAAALFADVSDRVLAYLS
jgi:hypothetical protein